MQSTQQTTARTTLYRLVNVSVDDLSSAIQDKYLDNTDDFARIETSIGGRPAYLVAGSMSPQTVKWSEVILELTGELITVKQSTASAVLLIGGNSTEEPDTQIEDPNDEAESTTWALSYGMGFHLLKSEHLDGGFGQRIALRTVDPNELQSLTRTVLGRRAMTQRSSIPGGEGVRGFGFGDVGEIVTRIAAKAEFESLTLGEKQVSIRGSDSLNIPLGRTAPTLLRDLDRLQKTLEIPVKPGLEIFEQLIPVKGPPELLNELDHALAQSFDSPDEAALGITWPTERVDEHGTPNSHRYFGFRQIEPRDDVPNLSEINQLILDRNIDARLSFLRNTKVQLFADNEASHGSAISSKITLIKWIAFEYRIGSLLYCLHDGRWYRLDQRHADRVQSQVEAIFAHPAPPSMRNVIDYDAGEHEGAYNMRLARSIGGTLLDIKRITTELHPKGIEPCDVYGMHGEYIHSKRLKRSQDASHLFAQMIISADSIRNDPQARKQLAEKLRNAGANVTDESIAVRSVVLVVGNAAHITADSLFTFSKVTLLQNVRLLTSQGVDVSIVSVLRPK